ncbi:MAG: hypothetical protein ABJB33_00960 [Gemmatimonadota bacterium]
MKKHTSSFFAAAALVALAACGSSDGGPSYSSTIDESNMSGAAEVTAGFVSDIASGMLSGDPSADFPLAPAFQGGSFGDRVIRDFAARAARRSGRSGLRAAAPQLISAVCTPTETGVDELGDPIDTDADGIPDDYRLNFGSNCSEVEGDWTWTYSGSFRFRDVAGLYGFILDATNLKYSETNVATGVAFSFSVNGTERGTYATSGIDHIANVHYAITEHYDDAVITAPGLQAAAPIDLNVSYTWVENSSYDPESPLSLEANIPSGDLSVDLDFRIIGSQTGQPSIAFRFQLTTPTVLHYENVSCYDFDSGQLKGALNNSASIYFLVTWTGCGTATYESFGTTQPAVTVSAFPYR